MFKGIPVNLIIGSLGVGKTTALHDLLEKRPAGSRWFSMPVGDVGGGCPCCSLLPMFEIQLALLLRDHRPERILIDVAATAHPRRILDRLRQPVHAGRFDVRATLTIVSPGGFANPAVRDSPMFREQVELADVLVLNRLDEAPTGLIGEFQRWANALHPPKQLIAATERGRLDPAWLDFNSKGVENRRYSGLPTVALG